MVSLSINTLSPKNLLMSFNKSLIITSKFTINHLVKKMTETVLERGIREKTVRASTLPVKYNPINWVTWQQRTSDPRISHSPEVSSHYYGYCQHSSTMSLIKYLSCNYLYRYIYCYGWRLVLPRGNQKNLPYIRQTNWSCHRRENI